MGYCITPAQGVLFTQVQDTGRNHRFKEMTITEAKSLTFEFAQVMKLTKQQAISFSISALVEKGFSVQESFIEVVGQEGWDMLPATSHEAILEAVKTSF